MPRSALEPIPASLKKAVTCRRTDWRTIELSDRAVTALLQHSQDLPIDHPLRVTVELILERWAKAESQGEKEES